MKAMDQLEKQFTDALLKNLAEAERLTGIKEVRLAEAARERGGAAAVRQMLKRRQMTRQFDALKQCGRPDLSPEALAVKGKYAPLFSDEEVNLCLSALLEAGMY